MFLFPAGVDSESVLMIVSSHPQQVPAYKKNRVGITRRRLGALAAAGTFSSAHKSTRRHPVSSRLYDEYSIYAEST